MAKYEINELVCVRDRGKIYEAKIIASQQMNDIWHYFVHFQGWNKKWDRWTEEGDISKKTAPISRMGISDGSEEVLPGNKRTRTRKSEPEAKRRKQLEEENLEDIADDSSMFKLQIPTTLKKRLMDEWELISKKPHRLVTLPRYPTVSNLIEQYLLDRNDDSEQEEKVRDLFQCLIAFFNRALPLVLLYRQEREQFERLSEDPSFQPATTYGAEHLLRLFVKLPQLFVDVEANQTDIRFMKQKITEFLKYLQKQENVFLPIGSYKPLIEEENGAESTKDSQIDSDIKLVT